METVIQKKRGRPSTGRDPPLPVRLPLKLVQRIDGWAKQYQGMNRSAAVRCLLELGLRTPPAKIKRVKDPKDQRAHYERSAELIEGKT